MANTKRLKNTRDMSTASRPAGKRLLLSGVACALVVSIASLVLPVASAEKEIDNFISDGSSHLDDEDSADPVEDELEHTECKGYWCEFKDKCGDAPLNPLTRIKKKGRSKYMNGGVDQKYGEWPHFAHVSIVDEKGYPEGLCGGVLISDKHVLTAAHCMGRENFEGYKTFKNKRIKVILGDHRANKKDKHERKFNVSSKCVSKRHLDYREKGNRFDWSVLTLDGEVEFDDYVAPACLPFEKINHDKEPKCFVVGMGVVKYHEDQKHEIAKKVQMMRLKRVSCQKWGIKHDDRSRQCMTKFDHHGDTCSGDSGGPVVCLSPDKKWTVEGLVSYGEEKCDGESPVGWVGVYTRVPALLEHMQEECDI